MATHKGSVHAEDRTFQSTRRLSKKVIARMWLMSDGDVNEPEIECSGTPKELQELGRKLIQFAEQISISFDVKESQFYRSSIKESSFTKVPSDDALLSIVIRKSVLEFSGGSKAYQALGQSLVNFFDGAVSQNDHFQIDQCDGTIISASSSCTLIFCAV